MRTRRSAKRRFEADWQRLVAQTKDGGLNLAAECLLAYQFQEREDGRPSDRARLGAYFTAQQMLMQRAFMTAFGGRK